MAAKKTATILVEGARQNTLKNVTVRLPVGELTVVTGVSGSGKSSFAFDTVYAEGQRRYVETFSPYARQFLERMDRPRVDRVEGIPPAIAIDQTNPVRTSRSTVGTMTELNDHLKLLYARAARLFCGGCGREVRRDTPESIADAVLGEAVQGALRGPAAAHPHRTPCGPSGGGPPLRATPPLSHGTIEPDPVNVPDPAPPSRAWAPTRRTMTSRPSLACLGTPRGRSRPRRSTSWWVTSAATARSAARWKTPT